MSNCSASDIFQQIIYDVKICRDDTGSKKIQCHNKSFHDIKKTYVVFNLFK